MFEMYGTRILSLEYGSTFFFLNMYTLLYLCISNYLINLFLTVLDLCCCTLVLSSCREWELLSSCGAWAFHCDGFSCCRAQTLGSQASVAVVYRFSSCSSQSLEHRLSIGGART